MAHRSATARLAGIVGLILGGSVIADGLAVGQPLPDNSFVDQFDATHDLDGCDRLLFAPDRAASDIANSVLSGAGLDEVARQGSCYVADVSAMPTVITKLFAIPAMRDYPYPVLLDRDGTGTTGWPGQPGQLTVMHVADGRIQRLTFAASAAQALDALASSAP